MTIIFIIILSVISASVSNSLCNDEIITHNSSNTIINLKSGWQAKTDNNSQLDNIQIPFFLNNPDIKSAVFKNTFDVKDTLNVTKVRLWILGLHGNALITLNNRLLGKHSNLASTFFIDIDRKQITVEKNTIEIELSKNDASNSISDFRFPNFPKQKRPIGLAREIYIEIFKEKYIDNIKFQYKNNTLTLDYKLIITNLNVEQSKPTIRLEEEVISPAGVVIHKRFQYVKNTPGKIPFKRNINLKYPKEWTPENPQMYTVKLLIKSSTSEYFDCNKQFGFREITAKKENLLLNKRSIALKGITYRFNFSNNPDYLKNIKEDLISIKSLDFNAIRFVNYPPHPAVSVFADSIGLLLLIDNGFWRLPPSFYSKNSYFISAKMLFTEIAETFKNSASVIGIGVGNEPDINNPQVKKFTIVLEKYLSDNFNFLSYLSPLSYNLNPIDKISDFIVLNNYVSPNDVFKYKQNLIDLNIPIVFGNVNFPTEIFGTNAQDNSNDDINKFENFLARFDSSNIFNGYFVDSYRDWKGEIPSFYANVNQQSEIIYPFGLKDINNKIKEKYHYFEKNYVHVDDQLKNKKTNNFFSIIVFLVAIVFFIIYKRNYRLKENVGRSLQHPYGFFVDLRDRRIISVFNSTLIGLTVGVIFSAFISSIIYAFHDSIFWDEFVVLFIHDFDSKILYMEIINSPWKLFLIILIIITAIQFLFIFILKILAIFSKEKRKIRQIYSIISWSGAPLLFFIPICIFSYRFAINDIFMPEILWLFFVFLIWYNYRVANGFRILFLIQPAKMILLVFLTYLILIVSFILYFSMDFQVYEYLNTLYAAKVLY